MDKSLVNGLSTFSYPFWVPIKGYPREVIRSFGQQQTKKTNYCLIRINKTKFVTSGLRKEMRIWESWFPRRGRSPAPWVGSRGPSSSRHWLKTIFWSILVQVKILNWLKCFKFKDEGTYVIYSFFFRICSWNSSRLYTVGYRGGEDVS